MNHYAMKPAETLLELGTIPKATVPKPKYSVFYIYFLNKYFSYQIRLDSIFMNLKVKHVALGIIRIWVLSSRVRIRFYGSRLNGKLSKKKL